MKVFLVESSPVSRLQLIELLNSVKDVDIVGTSDNPEVALTSIAKLGPDIVILDKREFNEEEFIRFSRIKDVHPGISIIALLEKIDEECKNGGMYSFVDHCLVRDEEIGRVAEILSRL